MSEPPLHHIIDDCIRAREALFDPTHESAFRLFNGFTEGAPDLVIDLYASTALITNYADPPAPGQPQIALAQEVLLKRLPWLRACVLKTRNSESAAERAGRLVFGEKPDTKIREHGIWYAVNMVVHQDASLYLDTRNARRWALKNLKDKSVLNAFAYTGSFGVAALAGGAQRVVQLDRNGMYLELARASYALNHLAIRKADFIKADFFRQAGAFKQRGERFDCGFLDPPLFSSSPAGVVDQGRESGRLINKVRPLINDGGTLIAINNALYVSGADYMQTLETLCADGYLEVSELISVPEDFTGYAGTRRGAPITDPAPFNHSTKIAVLRVKRKAS